MQKFTKQEVLGLGAIFIVLIAVSIPNFAVSIRRARDQVRRDDLGAIRQSLLDYSEDFQQFPLASPDGKIVACKLPEDKVTIGPKKELIVHLVPCQWGKDGLFNLSPESSKVYLKLLGQDPNTNKGAIYRYMSDGRHFQIYAAFEGKDEAEYNPQILTRNLTCGTRICNVGQSYGVPTGISIEQYVKEIEDAKVKNKK